MNVNRVLRQRRPSYLPSHRGIVTATLRYKGKYLGSCLASETGDEASHECIERVKQLKQPVKSIILDITQTSVQVWCATFICCVFTLEHHHNFQSRR